jgi:hypothetical protein
MNERMDINLRQAPGQKPNPKGMLKKIAEELGKITKVADNAGKKWGKARAEKERIQVKEMQAGILARDKEIENERQKQLENYELEKLKIDNAHEEAMAKIELERQRDQRQALKDAIQCKKDLKKMGVDVDIKVVHGKPKGLFDIVIESDSIIKKQSLGDIQE